MPYNAFLYLTYIYIYIYMKQILSIDKFIVVYWRYTTEEGHRSVCRSWSFFNLLFYWITVTTTP